MGLPGAPPADPYHPRYRVWTGLDAHVKVFLLDANGVRSNFLGPVSPQNPDPVVRYCYFQNVSLNSEVPFTRRPVTGRSRKVLITETDEWDFTVEHFYMGRYYEFDPISIFNRQRKFELELMLFNPERPDDYEINVLSPAYRIACNISGTENGILQGSAKFVSEELSYTLVPDPVNYL